MKSNINTKENVFCTKLHEPATAIFASENQDPCLVLQQL